MDKYLFVRLIIVFDLVEVFDIVGKDKKYNNILFLVFYMELHHVNL